MNLLLDVSLKIKKFSPLHSGVFSVSDLKNLIMPRNDSIFYRILKELKESSILERFCRNYYIVKGFDPKVLSQRIAPESYISFGTVLSENMVIGSVPEYRIISVKKGVTRVYQNELIRIEHLGIVSHLYTGFITKAGISQANPEKAVLDCLYFYQKGRKFFFDVYSDIDYSSLNFEIVEELLLLYKNKKFVSFVKGVMNGKN